jgi:hypothetical protein
MATEWEEACSVEYFLHPLMHPTIGVVKIKQVAGSRGMISSSLMPIDLKNLIIAWA